MSLFGRGFLLLAPCSRCHVGLVTETGQKAALSHNSLDFLLRTLLSMAHSLINMASSIRLEFNRGIYESVFTIQHLIDTKTRYPGIKIDSTLRYLVLNIVQSSGLDYDRSSLAPITDLESFSSHKEKILDACIPKCKAISLLDFSTADTGLQTADPSFLRISSAKPAAISSAKPVAPSKKRKHKRILLEVSSSSPLTAVFTNAQV